MLLSNFREELNRYKEMYTYRVLASKYGVNQRYLWDIINKPDKTPPGSVRKKLGVVIEERSHRFKIYSAAEDIDKTMSLLRNNMTPDLLDEIKRRL